ncbi:MAG: ABC transporter ATP-binding protein [Saprospiraceae bacterium]
MQTLIEARQLSKSFGTFRAVNEVSFTVEAGEIFGLLGPNGAGKTTTLRMLSGLLTPSGGSAFMNGFSMRDQQMEARSSMGFLTGDMDLYRRLTPVELLEYFGKLYNTPSNVLKQRIERLVDAFGIAPFANKHCEKLSTGQKQRVSIARTLVHDPKVVVLDEPTTGLDIMASEFILQFIRKMAKEEGKALIFSTHNLTEVERLCDRIAIIHQGNLEYLGDIGTVQQQTGTQQLAAAFFELVKAETATL